MNLPGYCICGKPAGRTGRCETCEHGLRKDEQDKAKAASKKRIVISKVSEKKAGKLKPYAVLRRNYLNENPVCEMFLPGCDGDSQEIHHCSQSQLDFLETSTWMAACRSCHATVETQLSAEERRKKGFLIDPVNVKWEEPHKI